MRQTTRPFITFIRMRDNVREKRGDGGLTVFGWQRLQCGDRGALLQSVLKVGFSYLLFGTRWLYYYQDPGDCTRMEFPGSLSNLGDWIGARVLCCPGDLLGDARRMVFSGTPDRGRIGA